MAGREKLIIGYITDTGLTYYHIFCRQGHKRIANVLFLSHLATLASASGSPVTHVFSTTIVKHRGLIWNIKTVRHTGAASTTGGHSWSSLIRCNSHLMITSAKSTASFRCSIVPCKKIYTFYIPVESLVHHYFKLVPWERHLHLISQECESDQFILNLFKLWPAVTEASPRVVGENSDKTDFE